MSTSTSTTSGITFVLVPPWMIVGANVVWVHACAWRATNRQFLAEVVQRALVEQPRIPLGSEVDTLDELSPRVVDHRRRSIFGEAAHDLGRGHERVIGAERLRRVARRAAHRDATPVRTLLADDHRQARAFRVRLLETAGFGHDVVGGDRLVFARE